MGKKILLAVIMLTFIGCGLRSDKDETKEKITAPQTQPQNRIEQGMKLLSQQKVAEAIKNFDQAIKDDPNNRST